MWQIPRKMHVTSAAIQMSWKYRNVKAHDEIERKALINEMYKYEEVAGKVRKENNS